MSALLGIFPARGMTDSAVARRMFAAMCERGSESPAVWEQDTILLGVARHGWEFGPDFSGAAGVVTQGDLSVVADASLYYRGDLRRSLAGAGVTPSGDTPSHLIAAAYRAWGADCADRLEGDWAFLVWDRRSRSVFASRDFGGKRPLFYATLGDLLVIASTVKGILAHPACPDELDLTVVAEAAAGLLANSADTGHASVKRLPAGQDLHWSGGTLRLSRNWTPPPIRERPRAKFEEGAAELRHLLEQSVSERLARSGPTSVWLSGGWDSTAIFGAGRAILRDRRIERTLIPVSISYPEGDPGREDELIQKVADRWKSDVRWLRIGDIPFFENPQERAAARGEPLGHAFEMWNRALARESAAAGARIAFDGAGGDQLFGVSEIYFADLFRRGRWRELAREWRGKGLAGSGFRAFFRWAIQPTLPAAGHRLATLMRRGRPLRGYLERLLPDWIDPAFAKRHQLVEREKARTPPPRRGEGYAGYETYYYLSHPFFPRVLGLVAGFALEEGVEDRSPLYDRRIVEFAVARPRHERSRGPETKRLLRAAMQGLLPAEVLAPRRRRTGVTSGYFYRSFAREHAEFVSETLTDPVLEHLGIIDASIARRRMADYIATGDGVLGFQLSMTVQAELWLRARVTTLPARGDRPFAGITTHQEEQMMYTKPTLERFGSFRELTQFGFVGSSDGLMQVGASTVSSGGGCDVDGTLAECRLKSGS